MRINVSKNLSLLKYCIPCGAKCCKTGKLIGSPVLSKDETLNIKEIAKGHIKEVLSPTGEKYYILLEQEGANRCFFLTEKNKCKIQKVKPLDCLCYPVKAVYNDGKEIRFIIDKNCPAARHLGNEFIEEAKLIALRSIKRFGRQTYHHWLHNNVGWAEKATELEESLENF